MKIMLNGQPVLHILPLYHIVALELHIPASAQGSQSILLLALVKFNQAENQAFLKYRLFLLPCSFLRRVSFQFFDGFQRFFHGNIRNSFLLFFAELEVS